MIDRDSILGTAEPPATAWDGELALALALAVETGLALEQRFGQVVGRLKPDGSLVSEADLAADGFIRHRLGLACPADGVISEEGEAVHAGQDRVWVVDPLDGTSNYLHGVPMWGVSIALLEAGRPVVGVSVFPSLGLAFRASLGGGAWEGGRRLVSAAGPRLGAQDLVTYCSRTPRRFDLRLPSKGRMLGSETLHLALVAAGATQGSLSATSFLWDLAAGWLLVEEAGGRMEVLDGPAPWPLATGAYAERSFATLAAGSPGLAAELRAGLRPLGAGLAPA
jgi:myo-inositol-1(or 4)-monophosphatase